VTEEIEARLVEAGLSASEARRKRELFAAVDGALAASGAARLPSMRWFVPGRIEVLGKHTDYAGGRSLLCAVGRGFCVSAAPREDRTVRILDVGRGLVAEIPLDPGLAPTPGNWTVYATAVASRVARNFPGSLRGADIAFSSDLPRAAGLSSSSALTIALFTALAEVNGLELRPEYASNIRSLEELAGYLGSLENGHHFGDLVGDCGVGTFGGSEDQTAILCCRSNELRQYVFCPVRHERSIRLSEDWSFVVASSGVTADKTGDVQERFNHLSLAVSAILNLWNRSTGRADTSLFAAANGSQDAPERIRRLLRTVPVAGFSAELLRGRFDQFLDESMTIIPSVSDRLARDDVRSIGELVDRSQEGAERFLGNQIPETVALAREARSLGAAAASAFGAGFGGSVWALVSAEEAADFRKRWGESYGRAFPEPAARSRFFVTRPGPARLRL
jgi:galactokinase